MTTIVNKQTVTLLWTNLRIILATLLRFLRAWERRGHGLNIWPNENHCLCPNSVRRWVLGAFLGDASERASELDYIIFRRNSNNSLTITIPPSITSQKRPLPVPVQQWSIQGGQTFNVRKRTSCVNFCKTILAPCRHLGTLDILANLEKRSEILWDFVRVKFSARKLSLHDESKILQGQQSAVRSKRKNYQKHKIFIRTENAVTTLIYGNYYCKNQNCPIDRVVILSY